MTPFRAAHSTFRRPAESVSRDDGADVGVQDLARHVLESSQARNRKLGATSLGWPPAIGVSSPKSFIFSGGEPPNGLSGVQIGPGATPFTLMPSSIRFSESERVKAVMAPLVEA